MRSAVSYWHAWCGAGCATIRTDWRAPLICLAIHFAAQLPASSIAIAQPMDLTTRAVALARSDAARLSYAPVTRASIEAVAWVRFIYGPAEYVLLGSPALALSLAQGGIAGLGEKLAFDLIGNMVRESLNDPEKAAKKVAKSGFDLGLRAYRENDALHAKFQRDGGFEAVDARQFVINWHLQNYMAPAKELYNAISAYEGKDLFKHPDKLALQAAEELALTQAREAFGGLAQMEVKLLLAGTKLEFAAIESVVGASIGLGAYPPYRDYLTKVRAINNTLRQELGAELARATARQSANQPAVARAGTIIAIVDSSGSMQQNDPRSLRIEALRMMVDSLGEVQTLGVIDFDHEVKTISDPVRLGAMGSDARSRIREAVRSIDSSGNTSIRDGLTRARTMTADPAKTVWVLLTDGLDPRWHGEADAVPPGVKVHTIALSNQADRAGLSKLSRETGGIGEVALVADDLQRIIGSLFGDAEGDEVVLVRTGAIKQGDRVSYDVTLEAGQERTEFRVSWPGSEIDMLLTDPKGRVFSLADAVRGGYGVKAGTYAIMRMEKPLPGPWKVGLIGVSIERSGEPYSLRVAAKEGGIQTEWTTSAPVPEVGEPYSITLESPDAIRWERAQIIVRDPRGKQDIRTASLGGLAALMGNQRGETVYSALPREPGVYHIQIVVTGKTPQGAPVMRSLDRTYRVELPGKGLKRKAEIDPFIRRQTK